MGGEVKLCCNRVTPQSTVGVTPESHVSLQPLQIISRSRSGRDWSNCKGRLRRESGVYDSVTNRMMYCDVSLVLRPKLRRYKVYDKVY